MVLELVTHAKPQTILKSWKTSISLKKIVLAIFIDFKKAFDLINPKLLFRKLFHYGFDTIMAIKLLISYFSERKQKTIINKIYSEPIEIEIEIEIGVLQGSVLGPLLFLIFNNDLALKRELYIVHQNYLQLSLRMIPLFMMLMMILINS
jgi:hypothetical protein